MKIDAQHKEPAGIASAAMSHELDTFFGLDRELGEYLRASWAFAGAAVAFQSARARADNQFWATFWREWFRADTRDSGAADTPIDFTLRERLDHALARVNKATVAMQAAPDFLAAQGDMLHAFTNFVQRQQALMDASQPFSAFPSVREFDDLSRTTQELKREVRALQRKLADASALAQPGKSPSVTHLPVPQRRVA